MNAESKKIHEEYEELFGKAKRVNLFDTDEENETLRQYILAQLCTVNSCSHQLLFDEQKVKTYRVYALNEAVNDASTQGYHVFWLRTSQKNCDAAGYYDDKNNTFTILKFSKISDKESFDIQSFGQQAQRRNLLKRKTGVDKVEGLYLIENVVCKNPRISATIVTGHSASIDLWKDNNLATLEQVYPQINFREACKNGLMSIISSLEQNARKVEDLKNNAVVSKDHEAQYFLRIRGIVKAMGYYEPLNGHFFILKNSLLSIYSIPEFNNTELGKNRAEVVETHCMLDKKYYRVTDEIECESASIAASYVLGNNAQYFMWKDACGAMLRSDHPALPIKANIKTMSVMATSHTFFLKRDVSSGNYCDAHGTFDPKTNRFFIKAGSLLSLNVSPTFSTSSASLRRKIFLRTYCTKQSTTWLVNKDGACDSPSAAAAIVLGRNTNGRTAWVDKDGRTLNDIFSN
mgnify:CR=1 FL=1